MLCVLKKREEVREREGGSEGGRGRGKVPSAACIIIHDTSFLVKSFSLPSSTGELWFDTPYQHVVSL